MPDAKICGITTPEALDAAIEGGARFVGFVSYAKSPRHLGFDKLRALASRAYGRVETVLVTVNANDEELAAAADAVRPDWVQAHGGESAQRVNQIRRFARRGVIKAFGIARSSDFERVAEFEGVADMYLFDAKAPAAGQPGGNALAFDWGLLAGRAFARPWLLAGGLNPGNVREAMSVSGAELLDVSSGVESAPGLKDPSLIAQFLAAAEV
jgi:phosphoribosylanthranilate isomerase